MTYTLTKVHVHRLEAQGSSLFFPAAHRSCRVIRSDLDCNGSHPCRSPLYRTFSRQHHSVVSRRAGLHCRFYFVLHASRAILSTCLVDDCRPAWKFRNTGLHRSLVLALWRSSPCCRRLPLQFTSPEAEEANMFKQPACKAQTQFRVGATRPHIARTHACGYAGDMYDTSWEAGSQKQK